MTRYRFTGDTTQVFPGLSAVVHAGELNAGTLDPGDEFEADAELVHVDLERRDGDGWEDTLPPPEVQAASTLPDRAGDLVSLLSEQPDLADVVEAAEKARSGPRKSVLEAVERARTKE